MRRHLILTVLLISLLGCASGSKLAPSGSTALSEGVKFNTVAGDEETQGYLSYSETVKFEGGEKVHKKIEKASFDVVSKVLNVNREKNQIMLDVTTKNKQGEVDLHALAFPENDETLKYVLDNKYNVILADRFPKTSLFYIPPVFLPPGPMVVGDTWSNSKEWLGLYNNLPLRLDVTSILQGLVICPGGEECANIEVSGRVRIMGTMAKFSKFESLLHGRFLLGTQSATIYWSAISSQEILTTSEDRVEIDSCIVSVLKQPKNKALALAQKTLQCDHTLKQAPDLP